MKEKDERTINQLTPQFKEAGYSVGFDPSKYMHFFEDSVLSDAQKTELLHDLWKIIGGFVQLGFGIHPVQQAMDDKQGCGKVIPDTSELNAVLLQCQNNNSDGGQHAE